MTKKIVGTALMAFLALGLAACGNSNSADAKGSQAPNQAARGDVFTIGTFGPITGPAASFGTSVKQGAEVAIAEINENGGVKVGDKTYTLAYNFVDDQASEDIAITAYDSLIDSGVNAIMGGVTSGATLAILDKAEKDGIFMITPSGTASDITKPSNVFRFSFTDPLIGVSMADYVLEKGYASVAVLYNNADEYSTAVYEAFEDELATKGKSDVLVDVESFVTEDVDYTTQLTAIKSKNVDAIVVPAYYQAAAFITQQAKAAGMEVDFIGSDGWDGVLGQVTDASVLEGAVFITPFLATDPAAANFVAKYEAAYKATPDQFAADGYDTVYVIKAAMEEAGSIESADLIAAMTKIKVDGVMGSVTFDASGEPVKETKFVKITDGKYTALTK